MDVNKRLFKQFLATILRKHRHTMINLEHFERTRSVGLDKKTPIEEYGIKWLGGTVMLRRYLNENNVEIIANVGGYFDSIEINYYDVDGDDFITSHKPLIKELIQGVNKAYQNKTEA